MSQGDFKQVSVQDFMTARRVQLAEWLEMAKTDPSVIVCDAGEDLVCDICNADVLENPLYINSFGLYCADCRNDTEAA